MIYKVVCYENGKIVSTVFHDDRNMAKEVCRLYTSQSTRRAASVFIRNKAT